MDEYLNKGIKELIVEFPKTGDVLQRYNIGCVTCSVGTCLLKDIVGIHNLSPDDEESLMDELSEVFYPGREPAPKKAHRKTEFKRREIKYSPPINKLVDEHTLIKNFLALIPDIIRTVDINMEDGRQLIKDGVDFIRSYADRYHHAKEEDILFKYFDANLDIIKVMNEDHQKGRGYVKGILQGITVKDKRVIAEYLNGYRELLTEHIKKEDEILYPWMDQNLSTSQIGEMFGRFNETDGKFADTETKYRNFIKELSNKIQSPVQIPI
ncbi:MAG: hemerythrin domain-containing protein [Planctomycetota bacterium]